MLRSIRLWPIEDRVQWSKVHSQIRQIVWIKILTRCKQTGNMGWKKWLLFLFVRITARCQNEMLFLPQTLGKRLFDLCFTTFRLTDRLHDGLHHFGIDGNEFHNFYFLFGWSKTVGAYRDRCRLLMETQNEWKIREKTLEKSSWEEPMSRVSWMFPNGKKEGHRQQDGSLYKLFPMKKRFQKTGLVLLMTLTAQASLWSLTEWRCWSPWAPHGEHAHTI